MRRVLLLGLLAPALASAGAVTTVAPDDASINIAECGSATGTVRLQWTTTMLSGSFTSGVGVYRVYATNKDPGTTTGAHCAVVPDAGTGTFAAQIGADIVAQALTQSEDRITGEFPIAAGYTSCSPAASVKTIYVCVHYYESGTPADSPLGIATGTLELDLRRPPAPSGLSSQPGDGALNLTWIAPTGGDVSAASYRAEVTPSAGGSTRTVEATATSTRVDGLVNGTQYDVRVFSLSAAGNDSATAAELVGTSPDPSRTPAPVSSFWDLYSQNGAEQGSCSGGAAGPVALLGLAGLLAVLRRRK